uniref:Ubiquitin-like domain-containing protein n=1 Tax=Alexandrium catenella TaxID=2925 RepID=A0A7S1S7C6_ALECA|eukprot:CAMPEP_0171218070 /NCGR_PEP_ID=MMETSP0790-20130122/33015_1 /TAXON_ID=2925 /ORGANISM="Alexandrium catenella, Strain OF101" /LENGTH=309 /DNA_ID=CAMNT_0011683887 /DNA_START=59 /DNA_END=988 /DNA_ORIENTATION=-
MAAKKIAGLLAALCSCRQALALASPDRAESPVSLVQSAVQVHGSSAWRTARGDYLIDNSQLRHKGPGVLFRLSKNLSDVAGKEEYAAWGTVLPGTQTTDGWFRYKRFYLPVYVRGARVVRPQDPPAQQPEQAQANLAASPAKPQLKKLNFRYMPTQVLMKDGSWMPCVISGPGEKPDTFDIEVIPKNFMPYNMTVPKESLKDIKRAGQAWQSSKGAAEKTARTPTPKPAPESYVSLKVVDRQGKPFTDLRMLKKSPARTLMKMACDTAKISWYKCRRTVSWEWKEQVLKEDDLVSELGLADGDAITMKK